jgi:DNA-binding protein Fis
MKPTKEEISRVARMYRNKTRAAEALGIGKTTLDKLLLEYRVTPTWKQK